MFKINNSETKFDWLIYPIPKKHKSKEEYMKIERKMLELKQQEELFSDKINNSSTEYEKSYWRIYATMSVENRKKLDQIYHV